MQQDENDVTGADGSHDRAGVAPARSRASGADGGRDGVGSDAPPTNRASDKCNETGKHKGMGELSGPYFQPLRWGVDTLYLSFYGELDIEANRRLKELKQLAQSGEINDQGKAQYPIGDHIFEVKDKGSKLYPYALDDGAFRIQLSRSKRLPWAYVKVSAGYLAAHTPQAAQEELQVLLQPLGSMTGSHTVGRLDLYVDFASCVDMESWDRHAWVTRADAVHQHAIGGDFTGWSIGLGGILSCRLYDKTKEIEVSKKYYLLDLWRESGWDGVTPVWRLEFQFRREILAQLKLTTLRTVMDNLNGLWSYATTDWLRLTLPSAEDKTRSRWPLHALWGYLSSVDWETPGGPLMRHYSPRRLPDEQRLCMHGLSALVSFMAARRITDRYQGLNAFMEAIDQAHAGKAEFLGLSVDDYILERVQAKAREFNSLLNDSGIIEELDGDDLERQVWAYRKASGG